jgi:hypothetical protein
MVNESSRSGVKPQQTAEAFAAADGPATGRYRFIRRREEEKIALALMVSLGMIMIDELAQRPS